MPPPSDAAFRRLVHRADRELRGHVAALATGDLTPEEWHGRMLATLAEAHAQAGYQGRLRAGDTAPFDADDRRFGQLVAQEELSFLDAFRRDLEGGRYMGEDGALDEAAVVRRTEMYAARLHGTANEALALVADEEIAWVLGDTDHCRSCLRLAENSPYRAGMLPTVPRGGRTICLVACGCRIETASGLVGFAP